MLTGGELFTGDVCIFVSSVLGGQVSWRFLARNCTVAWIVNFLGCLTWAGFIAYLSNALEDVGQAEFAMEYAVNKAVQPWGNVLLKGIGANFMVCLGVWLWNCAEDVVSGKLLVLYYPITGFVITGMEHSIANMFYIPVGMILLA